MPANPRITTLLALATLGCAVAASASDARPDPAIARGAEIARDVCAACHVVAERQEFPPLLDRPTPSFMEIANRPGMDAKAIQRFITSTHWDEKTLPMRMPDLMITPRQSAAVARYIMSLRRH